ncbi:SURF1 family protein [Rheinheimera soli]|uniref:SURF1 family protein n=1 Tax=Rheinheimera soli TaxID=443616 RepID=UPI001E28906D|nr:SURF1 family protein [Rheinheimera soli]
MQAQPFAHLSRHWLLALCTLAAFVLLIKLSYWQWQRAEYKQAQLDQLHSAQQQGPVRWTDVPAIPVEQLDGLELQGKAVWLKPAVWLLDNQLIQGKPGYDVVIPVLVSNQGPALLVNLGWIEAPMSRDQLPELDIPAEFEMAGLLRTELKGFRLGLNLEETGLWPQRMQQVEPAELSRVLGQELYPALLYQYQSPYLYHYKAVVMPPEKHRAYALQWLLLAVAVVVVAWFMSKKEL